ncbi:MAG: methylmalonyl Co-A mutase-associated GTPase MeaB [Ignavibacteriales bacterium]|nr:methylmalonyl Co-A mutase-associated GTPase MeaB [Ignavibacteriales bacterium]
MSRQNHAVEDILQGDRRAIARVISSIENGESNSTTVLRSLFSSTGRAYRVGVTGPPGAGKSTLTNKLAKFYRGKKLKVGVIAVDPTSPFTGGALLGDRVRMTDVEMDEGVFIRSMASRGSLGGLSKKAKEAADVLDAAGFDVILMETVGVGQSELDIAGAADTTVVVLVPESGDGVQAMKAGLMEIGDFFVLNKADRPGADQAVMSIKMILGFRSHDEKSWIPDVVKTQANEGKGIENVAAAVEKHRAYLSTRGGLDQRRKTRLKNRIREIIDDQLQVDFWNHQRSGDLDRETEHALSRKLTPYDIAERLISDFKESK